MEGTMRAIVKTARGYGNMEVLEVPIPKVGPDDVLMKVYGSGICGTDVHIYRDEYTKYVPGLIIGHEFSATVAEIGENVTNVKVGDRVVSDVQGPDNGMMGNDFINGAHAEYIVMPYNQVHILPDCLSMKDGIMMEPFVACQHGILECMRVRPGDFCVVIGCGPIGIVMLQTLQMYTPRGTMITGTRNDDFRLDMARKYNPTYVMYSDEDVVGKVMEATGGKGADIVIECSGSDAGLAQAIEMVKLGGQINSFAVYNNKLVKADLSQISLKCLTMVGSWSWIGYPEEATRRTGGAISWERAINIASASRIDLGGLITHEFALEEFEEAFEVCQKQKGGAVMFNPTLRR